MRLIDADALRKCVMKWLPKDPCGIEEKEFLFETDICVSMLMEIDEQPTIEPQKWISCDERLPKYSQPVLTYNLKENEYEVNHIIDEEDGEWFIYGVDAWIPLPEPYEKRSNNESKRIN